MSKDNGGPAYPGTQYAQGIRPSGHNEGMTLRDYFAAKAMQSLTGRYACVEVVRAAYEHADAMLAERAK
jgi:hypothetical protein